MKTATRTVTKIRQSLKLKVRVTKKDLFLCLALLGFVGLSVPSLSSPDVATGAGYKAASAVFQKAKTAETATVVAFEAAKSSVIR